MNTYEHGIPMKVKKDNFMEYVCLYEDCDWRIGRWCGQELHDNEYEKRDCKGGPYHARRVTLNGPIA